MSILNFHSVIMNVSSKESLYCHGDKGLFIKIIVVSLFREETAVMHRPLNCMLSALIVVFTSSGLVRPSPRQAVSGEATLQTTFFAICPSIIIAILLRNCAQIQKKKPLSLFETFFSSATHSPQFSYFFFIPCPKNKRNTLFWQRKEGFPLEFSRLPHFHLSRVNWHSSLESINTRE